MDYPISFAEQLAQHLKAFRRLRGMTQAQLALQLGVSQSRVADIESEPGKVSLENVLKVLAALDVRMVLRNMPDAYVGKSPKTLAEMKVKQDLPNLEGEDW